MMRNFPTRHQVEAAGDLKFGDDPRLTENASAKLARKRAEAQAAADALNKDTLGKVPLETVPEPPKSARPIIVLSTTVAYRGRIITISNDGMTLDQFCDMLDKKFGVAE